MLMQTFMPDKLQSQKKSIFRFFWWKDLTIDLTGVVIAQIFNPIAELVIPYNPFYVSYSSIHF